MLQLKKMKDLSHNLVDKHGRLGTNTPNKKRETKDTPEIQQLKGATMYNKNYPFFDGTGVPTLLSLGLFSSTRFRPSSVILWHSTRLKHCRLP